ncbi:MAG: DUF2333 family protein [Syntrophobacteraceae bacterium]
MRPRMLLIAFVLVSLVAFGATNGAVALQKHSLEPAESGTTADQAKPAQKPPAAGPEKAASPAAQPQAGHGPAQAPSPSAEQPKQEAAHAQPKAADTQGDKQPAEHGDAHGGGDGHGVKLPELSPIPGVTFVDTMIRLMEHELYGRTLGWRPNDILIGRFTDNINNYQLGVLEAMRFTTLRLKDSLARLGEADSYDPDLEQAANLLMISATSFWFPAAETSYEQAIGHLKTFKTKLETGKRSFYYRRDNLVALLSTYKDQLGNVNRTLVMPCGHFEADDHFYYAKGVAHVYYEILKVCRVGFKNQLASTMHGMEIMDTILHELDIADNIDPWLILNANYGGFLANHRANLNAPLSEAGHLLVVLSQL